MIKLETQKIKEAASKFLQKDFKILDLFYKIPGGYVFTKKQWDAFNVIPDLLMKDNNGLYFAFIITNDEETRKISEFIKQYQDFLPFKIFRVKDNKLFETYTKTFSKNEPLGEIEVEEETVQQKHQLAKEGWEEKRNIGKIGEEEVSDYLKNSGYQVLDLNYNSPDDTRSGIENWREYQKLPDGVAKNEKEFFFFDPKTKKNFGKKSEAFIVNERDYKEYQEKLEFLPVKIYFCFIDYKEKLKEMFVHEVNMKTHPRKQMGHDKNWVVDLSNELEQVQ